jgi:hypothetical protein
VAGVRDVDRGDDAPAEAIAVATAPTTPWSGAVCRRIVMEYDDGVADMRSP